MKLKKIKLQGFKSFDSQAHNIPIGDITVILGANGAGKSNIVSFFSMLGHAMTGSLQNFVGKQGSSSLLYYGIKKTEAIDFTLFFESNSFSDEYQVKLSHGMPDRLFCSGERVKNYQKDKEKTAEFFLDSGNGELSIYRDHREPCTLITNVVKTIYTYQFHDTSDTARLKDRVFIDDASYLRSDAGNLAAFLRRLKITDRFRKYYDRIVRNIQRVMPQFGDFSLDILPGNQEYIHLNWTDNQFSDYLFGPHQISDGSLRFMALATLLLQPPELLPKVIVLDEPELGLHPYAIMELAAMVKVAAKHTQVVLATQAPHLVDEFSVEQILIIERNKERSSSVIKHLKKENLQEWLEQYSLSDLWEKNVLGGRP
jgi:predicted ATPase